MKYMKTSHQTSVVTQCTVSPPPVPPRRNTKPNNLKSGDENSGATTNDITHVNTHRRWSSITSPIIQQPKAFSGDCLDSSTTANVHSSSSTVSQDVAPSSKCQQPESSDAMKNNKNPDPGVRNRRLQSAKQLSVSSPAMSPIQPRSNDDSDDDLLTPRSSHGRNKKFHKLFATVPEDERVLDYYSCAFISDILLQGNLYITNNYFGFYSNVFGHVTKILIPVSTITQITKEKTAYIIPNAVGVATEKNKYSFGSLLSRYTTFRLMMKVWRRALEPDAMRKQDSEEDNISPELERVEDGSLAGTIRTTPEGGELAITSQEPESVPKDDYVACLETIEDETEEKNLLADPSCPDEDVVPEASRVEDVEGKRRTVSRFVKKVTGAVSMAKINDYVVYLSSLPRTTLLLLICTILLLFLYMSAVFLIYRLNTMPNHYGYYGQDGRDIQNLRQAYQVHSEMHAASVGHLRESLSVHIQQLVEVRKSLETLRFLVSSDGSDTFQEDGDVTTRQQTT